MVAIEPRLSKMALPSKTFVIMAAGSPLLSLADQSSDIANIIKSENLGYTMEHGDSDGLAALILKAYDERAELSEKGRNARKFAEQNTARSVQTYKYFKILSEMVGK